jgi:hypothetical protein
MKKIFCFLFLIVSVQILACTKPLKIVEPPVTPDSSYFAKGADLTNDSSRERGRDRPELIRKAGAEH